MFVNWLFAHFPRYCNRESIFWPKIMLSLFAFERATIAFVIISDASATLSIYNWKPFWDKNAELLDVLFRDHGRI